jgi:hypothetical protein
MEEYFVVSLSEHRDRDKEESEMHAEQLIGSPSCSRTGSSVQSDRRQDLEQESFLGSLNKETRESDGMGGDLPPCQILPSIPQMDGCMVFPPLTLPGSSAAESAKELRPDEPLPPRGELETQLSDAQTVVEADRIKAFCARVLKMLAPPLLREIESSRKLNAEAEPFTPRRITRRAAAAPVAAPGKLSKKASAADTALLKALGITPEDLSVSNEDLLSLKKLFDSPLSNKHLRVVASIFGKVMPKNLQEEAPIQREVRAL